MRTFVLLLLFSAVLNQANAVTFANGEVVDTVTNMATFDSVVNGTDLSAYAEDGIVVAVPNSAFGDFNPGKGNAGSTFSGGFHYPSGGADGATHISLVGGGTFSAIDLTAGDGWGTPEVTSLQVWAFDGATLLYNATHTVLAGSKIGLTDAGGMTDVYIASAENFASTQALGLTSYQALATDNVRIGEPVPEPATMIALGLGLAVAARRRRR